MNNKLNSEDSIYMTPPEFAKRWRRTEQTVKRWRRDGNGPSHTSIGGRVLYLRAEIQRHEQAAEVKHDPVLAAV